MYWLSGLTCDDTNFAMKAGPRAFSAAEKEGIAIVMPDTSPRGSDDVANVDSYDLGIGAGFYVNATEEPYSSHYRMYDYVTEELPALLEEEFAIGKDGMRGISGHSMGGHGALTIGLKNPGGWTSVSAFSPICNRKFIVLLVLGGLYLPFQNLPACLSTNTPCCLGTSLYPPFQYYIV